MATTKYILAEQVMNLLKGGDASAPSSVKIPVIVKLIEELANAGLKTEMFTTQMASGETIPDGLVISNYDKIPVEPYKKNFSRAKFPFIPVALPRNIGYHFVGPHVSDDQLDSNILTALAAGPTAINLTWTAIEGAVNYYVERATDAAFSTNLIPLYSGTGLSFADSGLTASTTYYYRVQGLDIGNNDSSFANAMATTTT